MTYLAAVCMELSGPSGVRIAERTPEPLGQQDVRIAVRAAGLNFPDLLMTYGKYQFRPDPPFVPGLELSGIVIETGPGVENYKPGDRVMGGSKGGAFAEQIVLSSTSLMRLPDRMEFEAGACWRAAASTAWHALHDKAALRHDETVLVLGAAGGVGMAAVKLARHLGAQVIAVASTHQKRSVAVAAGADHALDPADEDLANTVKRLTGGKGADVVYDPVGGKLALTATRAIAWAGRYLIVGFASGEIPSFPANHAMIKGYSLIGLRAGESSRRDPELARRSASALAELAEDGIMMPHISHRFPLDDARNALRTLENREVIGRAVLVM